MNVLDIAKQIGQAIEEGDDASLQRLATELAGYASHPRHREFAQALLNRIDTAVTALQAAPAAEVFESLKPGSQLPSLLDKAQHLCAIHAAAPELWPSMVERMLKQEWSAAESRILKAAVVMNDCRLIGKGKRKRIQPKKISPFPAPVAIG